MTREDVFKQCTQQISKTNCLLLELPTGYGKTKLSIDLVNYIIKRDKIKVPKILILVAKRVHKQTWRDEIEKWGGMGNAIIRMECYESLHKCSENWDIILLDEVHHVGSPTRMEILSKIPYKYMIGLSATIPRKVKQYFRYRYHSELVSCNIIEAIEDDVLPEPEILLFPLLLDNRNPTETWEINGKVKGYVVYGSIKDIWKYKREKTHAILSCTQRQKLLEFDRLIEWEKNKYMMSRNPALERSWLYHAGKRLEFLAYCKNQIVSDILKKLSNERTITFCKTIEQCEELGKNCIHSKNGKSDEVYEKFNEKKIKHITAVNILNENANLVDCKYAIFANISSSDIVIPQRLGRSMRHKHPVIIFPYYKDTREEEIITKMLKDFNKDFIRTINSIEEI